VRGCTYGFSEFLYVPLQSGSYRYARLRTSATVIVSQVKQVKKYRVDSQSNHRHKYNKRGKGHAIIALQGKPSTELGNDETRS